MGSYRGDGAGHALCTLTTQCVCGAWDLLSPPAGPSRQNTTMDGSSCCFRNGFYNQTTQECQCNNPAWAFNQANNPGCCPPPAAAYTYTAATDSCSCAPGYVPLYHNGTCGQCPSPSSVYNPDTQRCDCTQGYADPTGSGTACIQSTALSQSDKVAIGVGLGIGVPSVLLALWAAIAASRECCPGPFQILRTGMRGLRVAKRHGQTSAEAPVKASNGMADTVPVSVSGRGGHSLFGWFQSSSSGELKAMSGTKSHDILAAGAVEHKSSGDHVV